MFRVKLTYPFDDNFEENDLKARLAVGRNPQHSGAMNPEAFANPIRDLIWETLTFEEARAIKELLSVAGFDGAKIDEH